MKHLKGVHHVAVSVPDLGTARRFYLDLLGAEEVFDAEWPAGSTRIDEIVGIRNTVGKVFMARLGSMYIEVFEYLSPRGVTQDPKRPVNEYGYTHFCLQVDDIDAVYERMLAAGITFHTAPQRMGDVDASGRRTGYSATYGRDFFGNVFELIECNDGSAIPGL